MAVVFFQRWWTRSARLQVLIPTAYRLGMDRFLKYVVGANENTKCIKCDLGGAGRDR